MNRLRCLIVVATTVGLTACSPADDAALVRRALQQRTSELAGEFTSCPRTSTSSLPALRADSRCLLFNVAENPDAPEGRQLDLQVMVVPAVRPLPEADPFVILVGGPGQAATIDGLAVLPMFQRIRESRDILLVDQRGTGPLSPFACELPDDDTAWDAGLELQLQLQQDYLTDCLAKIDADPRFYTTDLAVKDLDAIRQYLGYSQLNLWGVSYGTRVALAYLKYHEAETRTVVLDGVAPAGILPLEAARDGERALLHVLDMCREEAGCNAQFPALKAHYEELLLRHAVPQAIMIRDGSGNDKPQNFSASTLQSLLFSLLYSRETARLVPWMIERIYAGDFGALGGVGNASDSINLPMHMSVICSEDVPLIAAADLQQAQGSFMYEALVLPPIEGCKTWPSRTMPADYFAPVTSARPVLIFSASQDPVTPKRWAEQVAQTLPNSVQVEATGVGHGVFSYGCARDLVAELVEQGSVAALDTSCRAELSTRPFFVNANGSVADDPGR